MQSVSRYVRSPGRMGLTVIDELPETIGWMKGRECFLFSGVADFALGQRLLQFCNLSLGEDEDLERKRSLFF